MSVPFVDEVRTAFDFLVREFDFVGPHVETGPASISLSYTGRHIGVAVELDSREDWIDAVLVRLVDGEFPARYEATWVYVDRIAQVLDLTRHGGGTMGRSRRPSEEEMNARIHEQAALLRSAGSHVLEGDGSQLERFRLRHDAPRDL